MKERILGKISSAEFGTVKDYPFLVGLKIEFTSGNCIGGSINDKYIVNVGQGCELKKNDEIISLFDFIFCLLKNAKVSNISELKGVPVEITLENSKFKDFRILTEVL